MGLGEDFVYEEHDSDFSEDEIKYRLKQVRKERELAEKEEKEKEEKEKEEKENKMQGESQEKAEEK